MTITVQNQSKVKATGHHTNGNCKPVICIDTGEVFASVEDVAEQLCVSAGCVSLAANGKQKTCKGKRFCFVSNVKEHLDEITASVRAREAKANAYEAIERQKNALKNAEENVRKLEKSCDALDEKLARERQKLVQARAELHTLQSNRGQVNNDT